MGRTFLYFNRANQAKFYINLIFTFFCISATSAQVGIGTETPNSSSLLELSSTSKGLLVPRMEESQKNAISSPAQGLLIFQTNGVVGFYSYVGSNWLRVVYDAGIVAPESGMNVTLSDSDHGKIFSTQWSNQPSFPDPNTLSEGFTCTIVNYSNYEGVLTAATATFVGVRSHNKYRTESHIPATVSSNTTGIGGWTFPVSTIGFMSGGTIQIRVIKISGSNYYFVSGDFYYPNS